MLSAGKLVLNLMPMTFLPIVDRELHLAARKRATFWLRVAAALVALLISATILIIAEIQPGANPGSLGKGLFTALTWLSLAVALSCGLFLTSDCLSEEKREGTLGLLFLTDLRGFDVVLGKLLATSLRGFYGLLAVLPILGISLLMGGVTGTQFWMTSVSLVNALFISLAAGMLVSALSRESQKAMAGTLFLLLLLAAGGPLVDLGAQTVRGANSFSAVLSYTSPVYLFTVAGSWGGGGFWWSLLANQIVVWGLWGLTCVILPRSWQEKTSSISRTKGSRLNRLRFSGRTRRLELSSRMLDRNPVLWVACRERWQSMLLWVLLSLMGVCAVWVLWVVDAPMGWVVLSSVGSFIIMGIYLGMASQATRFFVESRRNGLLQLMLATPLTAIQIVQGFWRGIVRTFGLPLFLVLAIQFAVSMMTYKATMSTLATARSTVVAATPAPTTVSSNSLAKSASSVTNAAVTTVRMGPGRVTVLGTGMRTPESFMLVGAAMSFATMVTVAANLVALIWFGMWMGMTSKSAAMATLKTIVFVQVIPSFVVMVALWLIMTLVLLMTRGGSFMSLFPALSTGVVTILNLGKDLMFTLWARRRLYAQFRRRAANAPG